MSVEDLMKGMIFWETFVHGVEEFSSQVGFDLHVNELTDFEDCMLDMNLYIYICIYLTITLRGRAGYEMIYNQRGA